MASNAPSSENDQVPASATAPKNPESIKENMAQLAIGTDSYHCIFETGEEISITKSAIEKIPYFQLFFQAGSDESHFKPPPKNEAGQYVLPSEIEFRYLKPILAYVESGRPLDLLRYLSAEDNILDMIALFDFLSMEKPKVDGDLDSVRSRTVEVACCHENLERKYRCQVAAEEFCLGLAMGIYDDSSFINRCNIFSTVAFILSHSRTFRSRLRYHAKKIADTGLTWLNLNQRQVLQLWANKYPGRESDDDEGESDTDRSESPKFSPPLTDWSVRPPTARWGFDRAWEIQAWESEETYLLPDSDPETDF